MEFTRRHLTAAVGATAATTFTRTALGGWEPSERYPDPAIQILDPSFAKYRLALAGISWSKAETYSIRANRCAAGATSASVTA